MHQERKMLKVDEWSPEILLRLRSDIDAKTLFSILLSFFMHSLSRGTTSINLESSKPAADRDDNAWLSHATTIKHTLTIPEFLEAKHLANVSSKDLFPLLTRTKATLLDHSSLAFSSSWIKQWEMLCRNCRYWHIVLNILMTGFVLD